MLRLSTTGGPDIKLDIRCFSECPKKLSDTEFMYPAGYRISGQISDRISDILEKIEPYTMDIRLGT